MIYNPEIKYGVKVYQIYTFPELLLMTAGFAVGLLSLYGIKYFYQDKHQDCPKCGAMWSLSISEKSDWQFSQKLMSDGMRHEVGTRLEEYVCSRCGYKTKEKAVIIDDDYSG